MNASINAPIEDTADYTFTKLYAMGDTSCMGVTDTNELLVMDSSYNSDGSTLETLYTIALPESEILGIWYNTGWYNQDDILMVRTADGYYSCQPDLYSRAKESITLEPHEAFNALTGEVVDIRKGHVLLNDGYLYELPGYVY